MTFPDFKVFGFTTDGPHPITRITTSIGVEYLSDSFVSIVPDLIDARHPYRVLPEMVTVPSIPDVKPPPSTARFRPKFLGRMTDLGLTVHEGEAGDKPQHLYLNDRHVGLFMPQRPDTEVNLWPTMRVDEIPAVQSLVGNILGLVENAAFWGPWDLAASVLHDRDGAAWLRSEET